VKTFVRFDRRLVSLVAGPEADFSDEVVRNLHRLDSVVWSTLPPCHFTPGKDTETHCAGGRVGPKAGLDGYGRSHPTGIRSLGCPAHNESLYRLSYLGPHTKSLRSFITLLNDGGLQEHHVEN